MPVLTRLGTFVRLAVGLGDGRVYFPHVLHRFSVRCEGRKLMAGHGREHEYNMMPETGPWLSATFASGSNVARCSYWRTRPTAALRYFSGSVVQRSG